MGNLLSTILHKLGDAAECGDASSQRMDDIIDIELIKIKDIPEMKTDIRQIQEAIGYLSAKLSSLEDSKPQHNCKIIPME